MQFLFKLTSRLPVSEMYMWIPWLNPLKLLPSLPDDMVHGLLLLLSMCLIIFPYYAPYGSSNGGLPIPMWRCNLCANGHGRHTTRITTVFAFWQTSDNVILIMFGTSWELFNCSILTSVNAEYINSASSLAEVKRAQ
jgi:hypothetical protein